MRLAQGLRDNGVEVVYLEDLTAEVLAADPELREKFLLQWIDEAGIKTERYRKIIFDYMQENYPDAKDFVLKTMEASTSPSCTPTSPTPWSTWCPRPPRWSSPRCRTCTSPATPSR